MFETKGLKYVDLDLLLSQAAMHFYPDNKHNGNFGYLLLERWICKKPITTMQYIMLRTSMLDDMLTRERQLKESHC